MRGAMLRGLLVPAPSPFHPHPMGGPKVSQLMGVWGKNRQASEQEQTARAERC